MELDLRNYELMRAQILSLIEDETETLPILANISALLMDGLTDINWVGFYLRKGERLHLGPFQGKVACMHIPLGKGVCGTAAELDATQLVPDVHEFPGHIACDSQSRSELVIPLHDKDGNVSCVLDIDSPSLARFDDLDRSMLEDFMQHVETACDWRIFA